MLDFLARVWSRVEMLFTWMWDQAYTIIALEWFKFDAWIRYLYDDIRATIYKYKQQFLWFAIYFFNVAVDYISKFLAWLYHLKDVDYPRIKSIIVDFWDSLIDFIITVLPFISHIIHYYYERLVTVIYSQWDQLKYLLGDAWYKLRGYVDTFFVPLSNFVYYDLPRLPYVFGVLVGALGKLWDDAKYKLMWLVSDETINGLNTLLNGVTTLPTVIINDAILKPLNLWLTKMWYPHNPIDGE